MWLWLSAITLIGFFIFLGWMRRRDAKYLNQKVKDLISAELKEEIEKERAETVLKKEKFEKILADTKVKHKN